MYPKIDIKKIIVLVQLVCECSNSGKKNDQSFAEILHFLVLFFVSVFATVKICLVGFNLDVNVSVCLTPCVYLCSVYFVANFVSLYMYVLVVAQV